MPPCFLHSPRGDPGLDERQSSVNLGDPWLAHIVETASVGRNALSLHFTHPVQFSPKILGTFREHSGMWFQYTDSKNASV